jgi:hypothetical protein
MTSLIMMELGHPDVMDRPQAQASPTALNPEHARLLKAWCSNMVSKPAKAQAASPAYYKGTLWAPEWKASLRELPDELTLELLRFLGPWPPT